MDYSKGDIVNSAPGYSKAVFVITETNPHRPANKYIGRNIVTGKMYKLKDESIGQKIGTATPEYMTGGLVEAKAEVDQTKFLAGKRRAEQEVKLLQFASVTSPDDKARWQVLASAKPGDWITILRGRQPEQVQFISVAAQGERFVFSAKNLNGTSYRYPLSVVRVPLFANVPVKAPSPPSDEKPMFDFPNAAVRGTKRTEKEIIEDLQNVDCQLSPENLSCDGELPIAQVRKRYVELTKQRQRLVAELGREPTHTELWPELAAMMSKTLTTVG